MRLLLIALFLKIGKNQNQWCPFRSLAKIGERFVDCIRYQIPRCFFEIQFHTNFAQLHKFRRKLTELEAFFVADFCACALIFCLRNLKVSAIAGLPISAG
jgi:hypothetical protein